MAQKFVKKWFQPGEIDGEIVKIKEGQSLKAMEGSSEVDLIKIESGKVMLKGAEAALQSDISALESDIETALNSAKSYADGKISDLVNGAPIALDTLKELADKLGEEEDALNALITQVDENLQDAKDYADEKIAAIPAVDLSPYETVANVDIKDAAKLLEAKQYADEKVAAIPSVDLSGYYTKSEIDSEVSGLESSISSEQSRAMAAESALQSGLSQAVSSVTIAVNSLQSQITQENSRAQAAEGVLDGRLDVIEPKVTAIESDMADLEGYNLDLRNDLDQEISDRAAADSAKLVEAKAYTDSKIAAIPSTDLSGFYTKSEIDSKESALDSKISTEKGRVDAILLASDADKDTFAEIVQLINQVDTTNDQAFAAFALATNDSLESLDGRLDVAEPKISTLESKVSTLESEMDQAQSDLGSLDGRLDVAEPKISSLESNMGSAQSNISTLQGKVSTLESKMSTAESDISSAKSDISAAQSDISELETQVAALMGVVDPVIKEDEEIVPSVLTHVDLENEALKIYKLCVGRVPVFKNVDYSVSVVGGKTRITWIGDMASGGSHAIALSDKVYCTYLFNVASSGTGGSGGGEGGGQTFNGTYLKDFSASPELGEGEQLVQVVGNGGFSVPSTVIENGNLVAYSNYWRYQSGFLVQKTSLNLEANTTYQIKLTGSVENTESGSAPGVGIVFGRNDGYSGQYVYDLQNNFIGSDLQPQHWVNGVAEFRVTTDSTITDNANFQLFKFVMAWVYGTGKLSISKIEITKV